MIKQQQHTAHRDYFGCPLNIGDVVLGAMAKKNNYQDTRYSFSIIISKTKGMLRLHSLGDDVKVLALNKTDMLNRVSERSGRRGGAVPSCNVIKTQVSTGITEAEFTKVNLAPTIITASHNFFAQFP
jgi:hypothetical protein